MAKRRPTESVSEKNQVKEPAKIAVETPEQKALRLGPNEVILRALLLFFIAAFVYTPAIKPNDYARGMGFSGFIYDDDQLLTQNPAIHRGGRNFSAEAFKGLAMFWWPTETRVSADYFPLTSTTLWLEWRFWGNNEPGAPPDHQGIGSIGYHTTNILLHALCAVLLWRVLLLLGVPGAWVIALLWGIHPVCVESVAWVSERKNTLSMFLFLLTFGAWTKWLNGGCTSKATYLRAILWFILALLAKTSVVPLPVVLMLILWWKRKNITLTDLKQTAAWFVSTLAVAGTFFMGVLKWGWHPGATGAALVGVSAPVFVIWARRFWNKQVWAAIAPFFTLAILFGCVTVYFQLGRAVGDEYIPIGGILREQSEAMITAAKASGSSTLPGSLVNYAGRFLAASFAFGFYIYKCLIPINLILIYPQLHEEVAWYFQMIPGLLALATFWFCWKYRETWGRHVAMGLGFFVLTILPVLGLVKMSYMRLTLVADHFQYFSMPGIIALVVVGVIMIQRRYGEHLKPLLLVAGFAAGCALAYGSYDLSAIYKDKFAVWTDTLKKNDRTWQAHNHMGAILFSQGKIDKAEYHFRRGVELKPYNCEVHNNLGLALSMKGDMDRAIAHFKRAVEIKGDDPSIRANLANALQQAGRTQEAIPHYETSVKLNPGNPNIRVNLGCVLYAEGRIEEALVQFEEARRLAPNLREAIKNIEVARKALEARAKKGTAAPVVPPAP